MTLPNESQHLSISPCFSDGYSRNTSRMRVPATLCPGTMSSDRHWRGTTKPRGLLDDWHPCMVGARRRRRRLRSVSESSGRPVPTGNHQVHKQLIGKLCGVVRRGTSQEVRVLAVPCRSLPKPMRLLPSLQRRVRRMYNPSIWRDNPVHGRMRAAPWQTLQRHTAIDGGALCKCECRRPHKFVFKFTLFHIGLTGGRSCA